MLPKSPNNLAQTSFFDIANQLNSNNTLIAFGRAIDWSSLEREFESLCSSKGRNAKAIPLMSGLLMLKQRYDLND
jgi:hypothetical protein